MIDIFFLLFPPEKNKYIYYKKIHMIEEPINFLISLKISSDKRSIANDAAL